MRESILETKATCEVYQSMLGTTTLLGLAEPDLVLGSIKLMNHFQGIETFVLKLKGPKPFYC